MKMDDWLIVIAVGLVLLLLIWAVYLGTTYL